MNEVDRPKTCMRARLRNCAALAGFLAVPGMAQAQSFSPGDLVTTAPPTLNAPAAFARPGSAVALANPPDFLWNAYGDLSERFTTNAIGAPDASSDFESRAQLGFAATEMTRSVNAALQYTGELSYFANHDSTVGFSNYLNSTALVEVIPDHLVLQATAFAQPIYTTQLGNVAPRGEALPGGYNNDLRNTYGFSASPDFSFRLGDFLRSDTIPSYSSVFFDQPTGAGAAPLPGIVSTVTTKALTQRIVSGDDFTRIQWSAVANYSEMNRASGGLTQRSATGQLSYAIVHGINLVANGGYQTIHAIVPLSKDLSGPVILGGLQFDTPTLIGEFRVGEQYRSVTVTGHMAYMITPVLTLSGAATDDVTTPGANILNPTTLLSNLISGIQSGQIQIPSTGLLNLDANTLGISLQSKPARIKSQIVSLTYGLDTISASITGYASQQTNLAGSIPGFNDNLRRMTIEPSVFYTFSDDLTGGASMSYTESTVAAGRSRDGQVAVNARYRVTEAVELYGEVSYFRRFSDTTLAAFSANSGDVSSGSIRLGIRRQF